MKKALFILIPALMFTTGLFAGDQKPVVKTLLKAVTAAHDDQEVIMSHIDIPPHTALPEHYHPGEEYVYVIRGSGIVRLKGEKTIEFKAGSVVKIPYEKIHSAKSGKEGFQAVVFRLHKKGEPERILTAKK